MRSQALRPVIGGAMVDTCAAFDAAGRLRRSSSLERRARSWLGLPAADDPRAAMRRIAAEAVILQDEAEAVIRGARAREGLGFLAPRGGPLVRRLRASGTCFRGHVTTLPTMSGAAELDAILHHHALAVWVALDLLAYEWRSERIARQLDALDGLGAPAVRLDQLYAELAGRSS